MAISILIFSTGVTLAHCDTMDGPVVKDAKTAIGKNNVNYILKWVKPADEAELKNAFTLAMKVRKLGPDATDLADRYLFETLVRLHRSGEGMAFTGVKPSGTPIDEKILAADRSIEKGNLTPLKDQVPGNKAPELTKLFNKVMSLRNFNPDDVGAGREYVEAYVTFFKFAEGEEAHETH